jgi:RNA polymerase subunit RPABC4/transcription elongation factor Spt4
MPTFKHPCPHCGKYVQRDAAACPFCGTRDPFTTEPADRRQSQPPAGEDQSIPAQANAAAGGRCTGCGAALPANARFCTVCGTLAD